MCNRTDCTAEPVKGLRLEVCTLTGDIDYDSCLCADCSDKTFWKWASRDEVRSMYKTKPGGTRRLVFSKS